MSKNNKDSKGMGKVKTLNGSAKQGKVLPAKGAAKAAPVVKIAPTSARRPGDKPMAKENKNVPPPPAPELPKRKLGLRGAAPWAARHAAKHAAEARARAAEPPPPGSARATNRVPDDAEKIKAKIGELHNQTQKIRTLRKRLEKGFFEIGLVLSEIQQQELYLAKGYGSFEAFLEREIDLGKTTALKLIKVSMVFVKASALEYGMDRLFQAVQVLDTSGEAPAKAGPTPPPAQPSNPRLALPLKPPLGRVG